MGGAEREHPAHGAEQLVEHVAPVGEHVGHDAAAVLRAVVPGRALRLRVGAGEDPVAELAADREDPAEPAAVEHALERADAGQEQLVLHHAVLDPGVVRELCELERRLQVFRDRLLAVHVLAGADRSPHRGCAPARDLGVEVDGVVVVRQRRLEVGRELEPVGLGQRAELPLVAADEERLRPQPLAVRPLRCRPPPGSRGSSGRGAGSSPIRPVTPFITIPMRRRPGRPCGRAPNRGKRLPRVGDDSAASP